MAWLFLFIACVRREPENPPTSVQASTALAKLCLAPPLHMNVAPGVSPAMLHATYWLDRLGTTPAQQVLLSAAQKQEHQQHVLGLTDGIRRLDQLSPPTIAAIRHEPHALLESFARQVAQGTMVEGITHGVALAQQRLTKIAPLDQIRGAFRDTAIACSPIDGGIYRVPKDPDFDRNRCSMLYANALVRVIAQSDDQRWCQVIAEHASGWSQCADLSPPLAQDLVDRWYHEPRLRILRDGVALTAPEPADDHGGVEQAIAHLRLGTLAPVVAAATSYYDVLFTGQSGIQTLRLHDRQAAREADLPLTRDDFFRRAFAELDAPYAWGGSPTGRDCSRYLLDLFMPYGLELPRHSAIQAQAGLKNVTLQGLDESVKRRTIRELARDHLLLLFMPGHIMLYLGTAIDPDSGREDDYVLSALSEIAVPCPEKDTIIRLDRVTVTPLETGRNTAKGAFIERLSVATLF